MATTTRALFAIVALTAALSCQKPTPETESGKPQTAAQQSAPARIDVVADTMTFFPLIAGSVWRYEQFTVGYLDNGFGETDSVMTTTQTDSGLMAEVYRAMEGATPITTVYQVDRDGIVYRVYKDGTKQEFCALHPQPGQKVGELTYTEFQDSARARIMLETVHLRETDEWQGSDFERGKGRTSYGSGEARMELVEYRIGLKGERIRAKEY